LGEAPTELSEDQLVLWLVAPEAERFAEIVSGLGMMVA
jgi:hypothetical protein